VCRCRCLGPKQCGPNLLISRIGNGSIPGHAETWSTLFRDEAHPQEASGDGLGDTSLAPGTTNALAFLANSIQQGFQLATAAGPLCSEPMWGVCFVLDAIEFDPAAFAASVDGALATSTPTLSAGRYGPLKGQVMSAVKEGCKQAFEAGSPRLVEAMNRCQLQCATSGAGGGAVLGKMYGVIRRRRGRVLKERLVQGTQLFIIDTVLPVSAMASPCRGGVAVPFLLFCLPDVVWSGVLT